MHKLIFLAISMILLCSVGSCTVNLSNTLKSAADPAPANFGANSPVPSAPNSCPVISSQPANIAGPVNSSQLSPVSQGSAFQAEYREIPSPVTSYPAYGCTVFTLTPQLQWASAGDKSIYSLQVSTDQNFANLVVNSSGIETNSYDIPPATFAWDAAYYWRVRALNTSGIISAWFSPGYFSVIEEFGFHE